jgi:hypothetical protein
MLVPGFNARSIGNQSVYKVSMRIGKRNTFRGTPPPLPVFIAVFSGAFLEK